MAQEKKLYDFKCVQCNSEKLFFHKYIRCQIPVIKNDKGFLEYLEPEFIEDDRFGVEFRYACENGHSVVNDEGGEAETEQEMIWHLQQSFETRKEMYKSALGLRSRYDSYPYEEENSTPHIVPIKGTATFKNGELHPFQCRECGSGELAYIKYVKCITPVIVNQDGTLEYLQSQFDEEDYISVGYGFACGNGHIITRYDSELRYEDDIISFLIMTHKEREKELQDYIEQGYEKRSGCEDDQDEAD